MVSGAALVCSHSVARAVVCWLPCCWLEGEVEPAAAMVAGVQKGVVVADCWGEGVEVASCPSEVAADLKKEVAIQMNKEGTFYRNISNSGPHHQSLPMGCP